MNVHRLRAVDNFPPPSAVPPVQSEPPMPTEPLPFPRFRILRVRRLTMFLTTVVLTLAASFVILLMPTTYVASTSILIHPGHDKADPRGIVAVEDQVQSLKSAPFYELAIRNLGLERDAELTGGRQSSGLVGMILTSVGLRERAIAATPHGGALDPRLIKRFASKLDVEAIEDTTVIRISFAASSPTKAANLANAVAGIYLADKGGAQPASAATPAADLARLAERARYDEQALSQYKAAYAGAAPAPSPPPDDHAQQVARARAAVAAEEGKFRQLNTLLHSGGVDAVVAKYPSPSLKQLQDHLSDLRRQAVELSVKYGEKHPQMIALQSEQAETTKKLEEAVQRLIQNQGGKLNAARTHLTSLERVQETPAPQPDFSQDQQLRELEERAQASRVAYQAALAGGGTQQPLDHAAAVAARQLEAATPSRAAVSPSRPLMFGGAFGGSMLLSVLFALWLERPRNAFRTGRDIEAAMGVPNLSVVPMTRAKRGSGERVVRKPRSSFSEGIRAIYAGIQLMRGGQPRVVMVTSSVPDEGKTSIAVALGRLVARGGGRVVLVDCDLRHPSVARLFGAQKMESGLADVLVGNCDLATILRRDPLSPLEFLPAAAPSEHSAELIGSQALKNLIQVLRLHYDLVILDAAPVLPIADARLLSRLADKAIYVVEWNKTPREAVQSGLSMLRSAGAEIGGTVLNKADARRHAIHSYGFKTKNDKYSGRYYAE